MSFRAAWAFSLAHAEPRSSTTWCPNGRATWLPSLNPTLMNPMRSRQSFPALWAISPSSPHTCLVWWHSGNDRGTTTFYPKVLGTIWRMSVRLSFNRDYYLPSYTFCHHSVMFVYSKHRCFAQSYLQCQMFVCVIFFNMSSSWMAIINHIQYLRKHKIDLRHAMHTHYKVVSVRVLEIIQPVG